MFLRLALETPDAFALENVCGLVTMHKGAVLEWVLSNLQTAGYATTFAIGSPWMLGKMFNRPRVFIGCLRLDLARTSWWARNSPRH